MRGIAILALRDVFTGSDVTYNKYLRPIMVEVLTSAMRDSETENRRMAINTFNAASRNKPDLILPYLQQLLPLVIDQTLEDPSLIREVSMGPFKHKVDDGLEVRKVCPLPTVLRAVTKANQSCRVPTRHCTRFSS